MSCLHNMLCIHTFSTQTVRVRQRRQDAHHQTQHGTAACRILASCAITRSSPCNDIGSWSRDHLRGKLLRLLALISLRSRFGNERMGGGSCRGASCTSHYSAPVARLRFGLLDLDRPFGLLGLRA